MKKRFPLWLTLVPLVLGVFVWHHLWRGYADAFEAEVAALLPAGAQVSSHGFPYRLRADVAPLQRTYAGPALRAELSAEQMQAHRVPWQTDRQVLNFVAPRLLLHITPLAGAAFSAEARHAQASLRLAPDHLARLSIVWEQPMLATTLLPARFAAQSFELHLREIAEPEPTPESDPRAPMQAELVLAGQQMHAAGSEDRWELALKARITASQRIRAYAAWAAGGTVEIDELRLTDATGEFASMRATLVPDGHGALRIAGTIETLCPATLRALAAGEAPAPEKRARKPVELAFSGTLPGNIHIPPADPAKPPPPARGQLPPCPQLGGQS